MYLLCFLRGLWCILRSDFVGGLYFNLYCMIICCRCLLVEGDEGVCEGSVLKFLCFEFLRL